MSLFINHCAAGMGGGAGIAAGGVGMGRGMDTALFLTHHIHYTMPTLSFGIDIYLYTIPLYLSLQYAGGNLREDGNRRGRTRSESSGGGVSGLDESMDGQSQCVGYFVSVIKFIYSHIVVP